jgi:hypothetical protein
MHALTTIAPWSEGHPKSSRKQKEAIVNNKTNANLKPPSRRKITVFASGALAIKIRIYDDQRCISIDTQDMAITAPLT